MTKEFIGIKNHQNDYVIIEWLLGNTCNYSCSYCPANCHNGSHPFPPLKKLKKFVNKIYQHYHVKLGKKIFIQFVGGEPTLYKDFKELLTHLKRLGITIAILSNGSRTIRWWKEHLEFFELVDLSFHSEFADIDHIIELINLLADNNVNVSCLMLMKPESFDYMYEMANKIIENCPKNLALVYKPVYEPGFRQLKPYTDEQMKIIGQIHVSSKYEVSNRPKILFHKVYDDGTSEKTNGAMLTRNMENRYDGWDCMIGVEKLTIKVDQTIYRGQCEVGGKLGNIYELDKIQFPTTKITCNVPVCACFSELRITKNKNK